MKTAEMSYRKDLQEYTNTVLENYGTASQSAERESIRLAENGNVVALKMYADMVFYGKLRREQPFTAAFELYCKAAGLTITEDAEWKIGERAFPPAFWMLAYYLLDYRSGSFLRDCEEIPCLEKLSRPERIRRAFLLAARCIREMPLAGALNTLGRILREASEDEACFEAIRKGCAELPGGAESLPQLGESPADRGRCAELAEKLFIAAADDGYVYACNNLAAQEAARIVQLNKEEKDIKKNIERYISYLSIAADRYEPYAANRLGLFFITGEIKSDEGKAVFRSYVDFSRAKACFKKACVCPDVHSAWAYYNLLKYFPKDYERNIDLMNYHMDQIRLLDPKVYELAMEL